MANTNLAKAKITKNDEFYTRLCDIENELKHYREHFKGKTVYCNCDDPRESNFFRYFSLNFEFLGLKKLITTGFKENGRGVVYIYEGDKNGNRIVADEEVQVVELEGDGDFRSEECVEFLKEADVVVTNIPFSLCREFITYMAEYNKCFLIIGSQNSINYKEVFPLIKDNRLWLGVTNPKEFATSLITVENEKIQHYGSDGKVYQKFGNICWFTNLSHDKRNKPLDLTKWYEKESELYPKYDNYDAIEVSKVCNIPADYQGVMGVPITFLDKYCPEQFEIMGMAENMDLYKLKSRVYTSQECKDAYFAKFGKNGVYDLNAAGVIIKNDIKEKMYSRIFIRHKHSISYNDYFAQVK